MDGRKMPILPLAPAFALLIGLLAGCATVKTGRAEGTAPWIVIGGKTVEDGRTGNIESPEAAGMSVTINWLSAAPTGTRLLFGADDMEQGNGSVGSLELIEGSEFPSRIHHITVKGLRPGVAYRYAPLFGDGTDLDTPLYRFTAPPERTSSARIVIVGDMQPKPGEEITIRGGQTVASGIARENPDLVVQLGDLASIGGLFGHWLLLLEGISAFSPSVPFHAVAGNHDQYGDGGRNFGRLFPYEYADGKWLYHSFDFANAHFVMMNAFEYRGREPSERQKAWVEKDVGLARNRGADFIFFVIHDTVLSTGTIGTNETLLAWIVPLADRLDVDAVFYGHDHHYEHWIVEYGGNGLVFDPKHKPEANTVHYFCAGGGGARLEIDYGLITRKRKEFTRRMYRLDTGEPFDIAVTQDPWDDTVFIDRSSDPWYGQPYGGKHYYQGPKGKTCQNDTQYFGYGYGEQTLHYILLELNSDEARITVRYPNGDLLSGPDGAYPQEFVLIKD